MGLRVSTLQMYEASVRKITENTEKLYNAQEGLITGKKLRRPHDNPSAFSRLVNNKSMQGTLAQYKRNISFAKGYVSEVETALQGVSDILSRAKEIAVDGASDETSSESLAALAKEADSIFEQVLSLANSRWSGGSGGSHYIFSGFLTDTAAFSSSGIYQGDDNERKVEVGVGEWVTVGFAGSNVFQGTVDIFSALDDLRVNLSAGDRTGLQASIGDMEQAIVQVAEGLTSVGACSGRLTGSELRLEDISFSLTQYVAEEENIDVYQAASDVSRYQFMLEAAISSSRMIFNTLRSY